MIPSAAAYYAQAIENMKALAQPANATYVVHVTSAGAKFILSENEKTHRASAMWNIGSGAPATPEFSAMYRSEDDRTTLETPKGWAIAQSPIFAPTWNGIDDWIHYGLDGRPEKRGASMAAPDVTPEPMHTLVTVRAMGVAYYNVSDAGAQACPNGDPGHGVSLAAREKPYDHPLTRAVVDTTNHQFCALRFQIKQLGPLSANVLLDANLGTVDGNPVIASEHLEFNIHVLGFQVKRITSDVTYSNFAFPATVPEANFPL